MILIHNDEKIVSTIMDRERNPNNAYVSFLEIDEISANKAIIKKLIFSQDNLDRFSINNGKLYENDIEVVLAIDTDKAQIRSEYQSSQDSLQTIIDTPNNPVPTNVQLLGGLKIIARILKLMLKLFARNI